MPDKRKGRPPKKAKFLEAYEDMGMVHLQGEDYMPRDQWEKLDPKYQAIGMKSGFKAMETAIQIDCEITQKPPVEVEKTLPTALHQPLNKYTIIAGVAAAIAIFGIVLIILWVSLFSRNNFVGILSILLTIGGIFATKHFWEKRQESGVLILGDRKPSKKQVNSMNLYPDKGIVFEDTTDLGGQPWRCHNDGKMYFVNKWNSETKRLVPFVLPDQQYRDPEVFAQKVLELPAHRRIFRRKETWLQQLSPAIMILAILVFWIVMITTLE